MGLFGRAPEQKPPRRWLRRLLGLSLFGLSALFGLWIAVNRVEWLGPWVADGLRSVIGVDAVTKLEDFAYKVQDSVNQVWRSGEKPKAYWEVPEELPPEPPKAAENSEELEEPKAELPPFRPKPVGAVHETWSAPGDGQWVPMREADDPEAPLRMFKTLLHPDKNRSWAELFVVAIDLRRVNIHLVPGSKEPQATEEEALEMERPGRIPAKHESQVIAAFNGGFKLEHGRYGMRIGDITIVRPRDGVCSVVKYKDQSMDVIGWDKVKERQADMLWWRQTPNCMYEDDAMHEKLRHGRDKKWGATLDGETVIRRSAIGISQDRSTLYVGISNHTTAPAIAEGMNHAGAVNVAQLDVNFSYPKFVTFEKSAERKKRIAMALASGFEFSEDEFIRKKSRRDFFYVLPREDGALSARGLPDAK